MQVTVGGVVCPIHDPFSHRSEAYRALHCRIAAFDYDPSAAYDVVLTSAAGTNTTLSGTVRFTSAPTLSGVEPCIDRGDWYAAWGNGAQCPAGTTITIRGTRFPTAEVVSVTYDPVGGESELITLLSPALLNSTALTSTLPATAAAYARGGTLRVRFINGSVINRTNPIFNRLYLPLNAPLITSVSSASCDSLSPLRLANCRALSTITVTGSNLAASRMLSYWTSVGSVSVGEVGFLSSPAAVNASWYSSRTNASLVFVLQYFDADTNAQLQSGVEYTLFLFSGNGLADAAYSNAFRLSLSYGASDAASTSGGLSSSAIAGIVVAAVVAALLLAVATVWLVQRQLLRKAAAGEMQWAMHGGGHSSSEQWRNVELQ